MEQSAELRKILMEEKRLELETQKFELEKQQSESEKKKRKVDPILATILIAVIGFIATTVGNVVNNSDVNKLETRKFEFDLIKKGLEQPTEEERVKFLALLSRLKLVNDENMAKKLDSILQEPSQLPYLATSAASSGNVQQPGGLGTEAIQINAHITESSPRLGAIAAARAEVGQREDPAAPNGGPAVQKYILGGQGYGWSVGFVSWCYSQNKKGRPPFKYAYSLIALKEELIKNNWWVPKGTDRNLRPGDIYFIQLSSPVPRQCGIVDSVINKTDFIGIEGNTSVDGSMTGKVVARKHRKIEQCGGFGQLN